MIRYKVAVQDIGKVRNGFSTVIYRLFKHVYEKAPILNSKTFEQETIYFLVAVNWQCNFVIVEPFL